ncbi:hypothetical protein ILUMI_18582 [Ignelater luminosus]|uniref:Uncharacterized protein n=1 Tax=Ignelater luminosus TaxID=2038154 RepID=A0A8K0CM87_IGNLU|nr:hypothetical protein ILUMI_18582 [Ignelater luminosus]
MLKNGSTSNHQRAISLNRQALPVACDITFSFGSPPLQISTSQRIFFELLGKTIETLGLADKPEKIFNIDESGFSTDPSKMKFVGTRGVAYTRIISDPRRENTTVVMAASATGSEVITALSLESRGNSSKNDDRLSLHDESEGQSSSKEEGEKLFPGSPPIFSVGDWTRDNEEEWEARDVNARATTGLLVEDDQSHHIRNSNTAKTSWKNLEHYYEKTFIKHQGSFIETIVSNEIRRKRKLKRTQSANREYCLQTENNG